MEKANNQEWISHQGREARIPVDAESCAPFSEEIDPIVLVRMQAEEQKRSEEATRELAPDAYRLSRVTEAVLCGCYRRGKNSMNASDLLAYFRETRQRRIKTLDFSEDTGRDELPQREEPQTAVVPAASGALERVGQVTRAVGSGCKRMRALMETWVDKSTPDASAARKSFPLSAFAAIAAVAVSLMLIVASSVLIMRAERQLNGLNDEILSAYTEMSDLQAELEVRDNLLIIRDIAVNEYGMVSEEYVRTEYISLASADSIEAYEEEREQALELSALLSAIGVKK